MPHRLCRFLSGFAAGYVAFCPVLLQAMPLFVRLDPATGYAGFCPVRPPGGGPATPSGASHRLCRFLSGCFSATAATAEILLGISRGSSGYPPRAMPVSVRLLILPAHRPGPWQRGGFLEATEGLAHRGGERPVGESFRTADGSFGELELLGQFGLGELE